MMTRLTMPSVKGSRTIFTGSLPATQAAVPSATAAALPQVTMPHSAPVNSAMRFPAASISSSKLTNWREAASTAARTCGSIRLPPCIVRTLQQLMNGRTPSARYGLVLAVMSPPGGQCPDYSSARGGLPIRRFVDRWPASAHVLPMSQITQPEAALVLFSGGQDSTTCLAWALARFARVETVGFDYGQRHRVELDCRARITDRLRREFLEWG